MSATLDNLRFNLETKKDALVYVVARLGDEPVACGFVEAWSEFAVGHLTVVPERRRRGIGAAVLGDLTQRARALGKDDLQVEVKESDAEARGFLERRGFVQVGAEKAVVLELDGIDEPSVEPPPGVRIVSRVEEPDLLDQMYTVAVQ